MTFPVVMPQTANTGLIGLGVMGENLALNLADHGHRVALWTRRRDSRSHDPAIRSEPAVGHSQHARATEPNSRAWRSIAAAGCMATSWIPLACWSSATRRAMSRPRMPPALSQSASPQASTRATICARVVLTTSLATLEEPLPGIPDARLGTSENG